MILVKQPIFSRMMFDFFYIVRQLTPAKHLNTKTKTKQKEPIKDNKNPNYKLPSTPQSKPGYADTRDTCPNFICNLV